MRIGAQRSLDEPSAWQAFAAHGKIKCARAASAARELFNIGRAQFGAFKIVKYLNVKAEKSADSEVVRTQRSASKDASHAGPTSSACWKTTGSILSDACDDESDGGSRDDIMRDGNLPAQRRQQQPHQEIMKKKKKKRKKPVQTDADEPEFARQTACASTASADTDRDRAARHERAGITDVMLSANDADEAGNIRVVSPTHSGSNKHDNQYVSRKLGQLPSMHA